MIGAMKCQVSEPGSNPSVITFFFCFIFIKNTLKFCSPGRIPTALIYKYCFFLYSKRSGLYYKSSEGLPMQASLGA